jgi:D-amino-acid dehydrogenase
MGAPACWYSGVRGLDFSVDRRRVKAIRGAARHYVSGTDALSIVEIWRGLRPCTPDGLPIVGWLEQLEKMILATGHAMPGISLGPIKGKLSQLALGQKPSVDVRPPISGQVYQV